MDKVKFVKVTSHAKTCHVVVNGEGAALCGQEPSWKAWAAIYDAPPCRVCKRCQEIWYRGR